MSGGLADCGEYDDSLDIEVFLENTERIRNLQYFLKKWFKHTNPIRNPEFLKDAIETIEKSDLVLEEGRITNANIYFCNNIIKKHPEWAEKWLTRIDLITEKLFSGGKYTVFCGSGDGADIFRIANIPQFPQIELATLYLPDNFEDLVDTVNKAKEKFHDYSLNIILKSAEESPSTMTALRISLMNKDRRIPKEHREKYGHIFVVEYTPTQEELSHYKSYSSLQSLEKDLERVIVKFGGGQK